MTPLLSAPDLASALSAAYLVSGLLIAAHYVPLLRRAWCHPEATAQAQSLSTWAVWTGCRLIAFAYGWVVLQDVVFLVVVGADVIGRLGMAALVLRARARVARASAGLCDAAQPVAPSPP